jgi:hypothetical protein
VQLPKRENNAPVLQKISEIWREPSGFGRASQRLQELEAKQTQTLCEICQVFDIERDFEEFEIVHEDFKSFRENCYMCRWICEMHGKGWAHVITVPARGVVKIVTGSYQGFGYDYEIFRRIGKLHT